MEQKAEQKLLLVALGTTGGEVGLAFKEQVSQRTTRDFYYRVLCLDTSDQLRRSGRIAPNDFIHLATEEHYMQNVIASSSKTAPQLHAMLYPQFPPPLPTSNGAGNIRYSAATLLALPITQNTIRRTLGTLIGQLANEGQTKSRDITFAIVISAVGATGSGAVALLIPLILEAAQNAGIVKPNIDVFILHPVLDVSDPLLLANAEALYIELAAMQNLPVNNRYTGRKIILGSGGQAHTITRLEELEKTAATLIRLTTDARYGITQSYWDTLPNRGVLRALERHSLLPTHLSTATPITIGLANLGKQVIEVDTAQLTYRLVIGTRSGDNEPPHVNTLLSTLNFLKGNNPDESYRLLLQNLTEHIRNQFDSMNLSVPSLRTLNNTQKAERIGSQYRRDQEVITEEKAKIPQKARDIFTQKRETLNQERTKAIFSGCSLLQLRNDYREVVQRIKQLQAAASKVTVSAPTSEKELQELLNQVARGRGSALNSAIMAVQENLNSKCEAEAVQTATLFLNSLEDECQRTILRLDTIINEAIERFQNKPGWDTSAPSLQAQNDNSLYILALSSRHDIDEYYKHVSIFAQSSNQQTLFSDTELVDPMVRFRNELVQQDMLKHFFDGQYNKIFTLIEQHVEKRVKEQLNKSPLMNVFETLRPAALSESLNQAFRRAQSLMPFARGFAGGSVEECYVTACWSNGAQHMMLQEALRNISAQRVILLKSDEPTEIVVFYLLDGLAITAINELTSRCLGAFLEQRSLWTLYNSNQALRGSMRGIPVYSGYNLEEQVKQQSIVARLYQARQPSVVEYNKDQVPELADPAAPDAPNPSLNGSGGANGLPAKPIDDIVNTQRRGQPGDEHVQQQNPPVAD